MRVAPDRPVCLGGRIGAPTRIPARERILDAASTAFYRRGIGAVGVDAVVAEAGVAKATLYHHFRSKDELVVAFLRRRDERWRDWLRAAVERLAPDAGGRPLAVFDALGEWFASDDFRGCAFINAAAESQPGTAVHDRTVAHKAAVLEWVHDLAEAAGARDPRALARSLTLLLDGGLASGSLDASPEAPEVAKASAGALVAAATR